MQKPPFVFLLRLVFQESSFTFNIHFRDHVHLLLVSVCVARPTFNNTTERTHKVAISNGKTYLFCLYSFLNSKLITRCSCSFCQGGIVIARNNIILESSQLAKNLRATQVRSACKYIEAINSLLRTYNGHDEEDVDDDEATPKFRLL